MEPRRSHLNTRSKLMARLQNDRALEESQLLLLLVAQKVDSLHCDMS